MDKLTERQANLEIRPGVQPEVELQTGGKAILTYLAKPLYKARKCCAKADCGRTVNNS